MEISIIIPTYNEEKHIGGLIQYLQQDPSYPLVKEIIVVDGLSDDQTVSVARKAGARVVASNVRSRSHQMNLGADHACGSILYFLHADTLPPAGYAQQIWTAWREGFRCGCFRLRFDWPHWFLSANSWFTKFNLNIFRFGDQSLYLEKQLFVLNRGFETSMKIFEDQDIINRVCKKMEFKVIADYVVTSARKYRQNGPFRLQFAYFVVYLCYTLGFSQKNLQRIYLFMVPFPRI